MIIFIFENVKLIIFIFENVKLIIFIFEIGKNAIPCTLRWLGWGWWCDIVTLVFWSLA